MASLLTVSISALCPSLHHCVPASPEFRSPPPASIVGGLVLGATLSTLHTTYLVFLKTLQGKEDYEPILQRRKVRHRGEDLPPRWAAKKPAEQGFEPRQPQPRTESLH